MIDTSKQAVERDVCQPIINYVHDGRGMSEGTLSGIIDIARTLRVERDKLSQAVAWIARNGPNACPETVATIARKAMEKKVKADQDTPAEDINLIDEIFSDSMYLDYPQNDPEENYLIRNNELKRFLDAHR